jgi:hypothetical protein
LNKKLPRVFHIAFNQCDDEWFMVRFHHNWGPSYYYLVDSVKGLKTAAHVILSRINKSGDLPKQYR